ncbi:PAS domain-containing sensor histidine kinase [Campylobacter mucosalis]|uniref:PAS domain-containing sensor histidine kinase n=1 Tax=Campylobacter mucosalis TaxID=202 RepID=UPI0014706150|nr:PAS domain S-box protein [Campylobacter mucosalis]
MDNISTRFKQYQHAIEESNIVSKTDIKGIITFVNDEFCKICGYTKDELIGKNHNIVRHPDVPSKNFKLLWGTILDKKVYKGIAKNMTKDGKTVYLNTTISPILNSKGEIEEFVAIRHDVTQIIELNERLMQKEAELVNLNENLEFLVREKTAELRKLNENLKDIVASEIAKNEEKTKMLLVQSRLASMGEMIANIAHQWRQPLNELSLTLFKIKKDASLNQNIDIPYEKSKKIIQSMSNTIEDFRGFFSDSKDPELFCVADAITNSLVMVKGTLKKEKINLVVENELKDEIFGFQSQLMQVIINLLNNAKDALIERQIDDRQVVLQTKKDSKNFIIIVKDNAGGIDSKIIDKIFEPYFTTKHSLQGTGIGLYMSKLIIDKFKGSIKVTNVEKGAQFTIELPLGGSR